MYQSNKFVAKLTVCLEWSKPRIPSYQLRLSTYLQWPIPRGLGDFKIYAHILCPTYHGTLKYRYEIFSLLSLQQTLHFFRSRSCFLRHSCNLVMSCAFSQNFRFGGRKKIVPRGRNFTPRALMGLRRGLQIVRKVFHVVFLPRTGHSLFRWGHNEGRKQKVQLYWKCVFPSINSF